MVKTKGILEKALKIITSKTKINTNIGTGYNFMMNKKCAIFDGEVKN